MNSLGPGSTVGEKGKNWGQIGKILASKESWIWEGERTLCPPQTTMPIYASFFLPCRAWSQAKLWALFVTHDINKYSNGIVQKLANNNSLAFHQNFNNIDNIIWHNSESVEAVQVENVSCPSFQKGRIYTFRTVK